MTQAVVDDLEAVEVAVQHPDPAAGRVLQRAAQPLVGEEAVRGAGEPVVQRPVGQLELGLAAARDVLELQDDPAVPGRAR